MINSIVGLCAMGLMLAAGWVHADTVTGKIDLIETKSDGMRFYLRESNLQLYASGQHRDLMLQGFYRKANLTIGYQTFPCAGGMSGKCGTVFSVMAEQSGF